MPSQRQWRGSSSDKEREQLAAIFEVTEMTARHAKRIRSVEEFAERGAPHD